MKTKSRYSRSPVFPVVIPLFGFIVLFGCGGDSGDGGEDHTADNTEHAYTSDLPIITLAEAERQYRELIRARSGNTEEFVPQEGLTAYGIGAFLKDNALEYQSGTEMVTNTFGFPEYTYNFRTDFSQSVSASSPSMTSLPAIMLAHNMSSDQTQAETIEYLISFTDIELTQLSNPNDLITSEGDRAPNANQLVYGIYSAKVNITFYLLNESGAAFEKDASFIDRMIASENNVMESTQVTTEYQYALESVDPVQIGFLIKEYDTI